MNIRQNSMFFIKYVNIFLDFNEKAYLYLKFHKDISVYYRIVNSIKNSVILVR